jgi:hypothetical protein
VTALGETLRQLEATMRSTPLEALPNIELSKLLHDLNTGLNSLSVQPPADQSQGLRLSSHDEEHPSDIALVTMPGSFPS